jgi:hypothetical protein
LIINDRWMLVKTVTAFTIAHSLTLLLHMRRMLLNKTAYELQLAA